MYKFTLEKINDVAVEEKCEIKISNNFAALKSLDYGDVNISGA
jgi:hypothetical protein